MDPLVSSHPFTPDVSYMSPKRKRAQESQCVSELNTNDKMRSIDVPGNFAQTKPADSEKIRTQINLIESQLKDSKLSSSQVKKIQAQIDEIVDQNIGEEKKMAELGCLFYYIQAGENRIHSFYFETFKIEVLSHLKQIKKNHKQNKNVHLI